MLEKIVFPIFLIVVLALFVFIAVAAGEERKELRANAYQEGIGEEYDRN